MVQFKNNWLYIFSEYQIETLEGDPTAWWSVDGGAASALKLCVSQTMGRFCILCVLQVFLHKKKRKKRQHDTWCLQIWNIHNVYPLEKMSDFWIMLDKNSSHVSFVSQSGMEEHI